MSSVTGDPCGPFSWRGPVYRNFVVASEKPPCFLKVLRPYPCTVPRGIYTHQQKTCLLLWSLQHVPIRAELQQDLDCISCCKSQSLIFDGVLVDFSFPHSHVPPFANFLLIISLNLTVSLPGLWRKRCPAMATWRFSK